MSQFTAEYRLRVGPYQVLYDGDDQRKKVVLLKLVKRDEHYLRLNPAARPAYLSEKTVCMADRVPLDCKAKL